MKLAPLITVGLALAASAAFAQKPPAPLAFEVATVKPAGPPDLSKIRSGTAHLGTKIDASHVDIGGESLFRLICAAYRLKPYQVSGPPWLANTYFDIQAKIPEGVTADRVPEMLQALLADRFGLKVHHESKEQPVYALIVDAGGPKIKQSVPEQEPPPPAADAPKPVEMAVPTAQGDVKMVASKQGITLEMPGGEIPGKIHASMNGGQGVPPTMHLESAGMTMKAFADVLSVGVVDKPVVDVTGLKGGYDVAVDISPEEAMSVARASISFLPAQGGGDGGGAGASDPSGASIFKSVQRLGLKLDARKLPLDLLVIDHAEKAPTDN